LAIYTEKPAEIEFETKVNLSDGRVIEAGKVNIKSFYPSHYGIGGEPVYAGKMLIRPDSIN